MPLCSVNSFRSLSEGTAHSGIITVIESAPPSACAWLPLAAVPVDLVELPVFEQAQSASAVKAAAPIDFNNFLFIVFISFLI